MNARDLVRLLSIKHSKDVFVDECKDGPTHERNGEHNRMDAWAMAKSWAHPCVTAYEIKVSRGDFLQDRKWRNYLPLCNELYFVCPTNLILPTELPAEVGLLWTSKTGTKLYTKKRAAYRDVTIPESLFRYILMSRVTITREGAMWGDKRDFWNGWLNEQKLDFHFGRNVGKKIGERIKKEIEAVQFENQRLRRQMQDYDEIRRMLRSLGLDPDSVYAWKAQEKIEEARSAIPRGLLDNLEQVAKHANAARAALERIERPSE